MLMPSQLLDVLLQESILLHEQLDDLALVSAGGRPWGFRMLLLLLLLHRQWYYLLL